MWFCVILSLYHHHHHYHHHHLVLLAWISLNLSFWPFISISLYPVFLTISCVCTELLWISSSWSYNICRFVRRGPLENFAFEFIFTFCMIASFNKTLTQKAIYKQHKDVVFCSEQILEAAPHKTAAVWLLNFHLINHPSKTCWTLLEK